MIKITEPVVLNVQHNHINEYTIDGLTLTEQNGKSIIFKSYPKMANYLGLSKQGLYNKIRANMSVFDKIIDAKGKRL